MGERGELDEQDRRTLRTFDRAMVVLIVVVAVTLFLVVAVYLLLLSAHT